MSDQPTPNITVVYQYPQPPKDNAPWWIVPLVLIVLAGFLCNGLAYLFH